MKDNVIKNLPIIILLFLGLLTHFLFLTYPVEVVFDEVYFGKYVSSYLTNQYYFDNHPPLGKLMIAGAAKVFGYSPGFDFAQIGESANSQTLLILRFLPALFGSFLPVIIYLILRRLKLSQLIAFFGAFLIIIDNAVLIQSKFILMDIFLLFFGFTSIYFLLRRRENSYFLLLSVISATFAFSIKWTGLSFLGLIGLATAIDSLKKPELKKIFAKALFLFIIPFAVYYLVFSLHSAILYKSGSGNAFMSSAFQKTLSENTAAENVVPSTSWQKFMELNSAIYSSQKNTTDKHSYSSKWYEWIVNKKPIWYWTESNGLKTVNIYYMGNPVIWWAVIIGIISSFYVMANKDLRKKLPPFFTFLLLGYFGNLLPYILIKRATFLYHYLPALIFGIIILCVLCDKILFPFLSEKFPKIKNLNYYVLFGFLFLSLIAFLTLLPITYGF